MWLKDLVGLAPLSSLRSLSGRGGVRGTLFLSLCPSLGESNGLAGEDGGRGGDGGEVDVVEYRL